MPFIEGHNQSHLLEIPAPCLLPAMEIAECVDWVLYHAAKPEKKVFDHFVSCPLCLEEVKETCLGLVQIEPFWRRPALKKRVIKVLNGLPPASVKGTHKLITESPIISVTSK